MICSTGAKYVVGVPIVRWTRGTKLKLKVKIDVVGDVSNIWDNALQTGSCSEGELLSLDFSSFVGDLRC